MNKIILVNACIWLSLIANTANCSTPLKGAPKSMQELIFMKITPEELPDLIEINSKKAMEAAHKTEALWNAGKEDQGDEQLSLAAGRAHAARALRQLQICRTELARVSEELRLLKESTQQPAVASHIQSSSVSAPKPIANTKK